MIRKKLDGKLRPRIFVMNIRGSILPLSPAFSACDGCDRRQTSSEQDHCCRLGILRNGGRCGPDDAQLRTVVKSRYTETEMLSVVVLELSCVKVSGFLKSIVKDS